MLRLKELRQKRGLTQKELAELLEITLTTLQKYERGAHDPKIKTLIKIADFFDVSLDYLCEHDYYKY